jgi:hypothetical protein
MVMENLDQSEQFDQLVDQSEALAGFHGAAAHIAALARHREELAGAHGAFFQRHALKAESVARSRESGYLWAKWDADGNRVEPE